MGAKATAIFEAEDGRMLAAIDRIDRNLQRTQERFARFGEVAKRGLELSGVAFAIEKGLDGVKEALDFGSQMENLRSETDMSVRDLMGLREEFQNAGRDGNDVGDVMAKMMKNIDTGAATKALSALRLNLSDIRRMGAAEQFITIGKAINSLQTPMARVAAASAIFEKHAQTLLPMFGSAHFGQAAEEIGREAEILDANSALFSDTANELRIAGEKTRGFYVGLSSEIAPMLHDVLAAINEKDATGAGQQIGSTVAAFMESFSNGSFGKIIGLSILNSLHGVEEYLLGAAGTLGGAMSGALVGAALKFGAKLLDESYKVFNLIGKVPGFHWLKGVSRDMHESLAPAEHIHIGKMAEDWGAARGKFMGGLGRNDELSAAISEEWRKNVDAADARKGRALADTQGQQNRNGPQDFNQAQPQLNAIGTIGGAIGQFHGLDVPAIAAGLSAVRGGTGATDPMQTEAQRQTSELQRHTALLTQIVEHGKSSPAKQSARPSYPR